jgi:hypothetical protein
MWAQREVSPQRREHEAVGFEGATAADVANQITNMCERYLVRVASVSAYYSDTAIQGKHHRAIVVFEREPVQTQYGYGR